MTQRTGTIYSGGAGGSNIAGALGPAKHTLLPGSLLQSTAAAVANLIFKNQGWYSAGSMYEEWLTSGSPSTVPPSGHALSELQHFIVST